MVEDEDQHWSGAVALITAFHASDGALLSALIEGLGDDPGVLRLALLAAVAVAGNLLTDTALRGGATTVPDARAAGRRQLQRLALNRITVAGSNLGGHGDD